MELNKRITEILLTLIFIVALLILIFLVTGNLATGSSSSVTSSSQTTASVYTPYQSPKPEIQTNSKPIKYAPNTVYYSSQPRYYKVYDARDDYNRYNKRIIRNPGYNDYDDDDYDRYRVISYDSRLNKYNDDNNYIVYVKNNDYKGGYFTVRLYYDDYNDRLRYKPLTHYIPSREERAYVFRNNKNLYYHNDYEVIPYRYYNSDYVNNPNIRYVY